MNARLYNPVIGLFFSPDPVIQDFENTQCLNRYSYCRNNPVMNVDLDGRVVDRYYDENGEYLYADNRSTDYIKIILREEFEQIKHKYSDMILKKENINLGFDEELQKQSKFLVDSKINSKAISNILMDIISEMPEVSIKSIANNRINVLQYYTSEYGPSTNSTLKYGNPSNGISPFSTRIENDGSISLTARFHTNDMRLIETVSNIKNALGIHEYYGHGIKKISEINHEKAYEMQFYHSTWPQTTPYFQKYMKLNYNDYKKKL